MAWCCVLSLYEALSYFDAKQYFGTFYGTCAEMPNFHLRPKIWYYQRDRQSQFPIKRQSFPIRDILTASTIDACIVHSNLTTVTLYYNLPKSQINRLQQIENCLARTVVKVPKSSHITPILRSLHWLKINERIEYKQTLLTHLQSSHYQPAWLPIHNLISLQSTCSTRSSSAVTLPRQSDLSHYKSPTALLHHLTCGISSLLHSVNLILFTLLLVHLSLRISPHHSHRACSRHLSLLRSFTLDSKLISITKITNHFLHSPYFFRTASMDLKPLLRFEIHGG